MQPTTYLYLSVPFEKLCVALPEAKKILKKYKSTYTDEYSEWLGRWIQKAERICGFEVQEKQKNVDKLVQKLMTQILVSPFDKAPFFTNSTRQPLLFKGLVFPHWMLQDIFTLMGNASGISQAKPHAFMIKMLSWINALMSQGAFASGNTQLFLSEPQMDEQLLLSLNVSEQPELILKKLLIYRSLIKMALSEIERRKRKTVKSQLKQIRRVGYEQKICLAQGSSEAQDLRDQGKQINEYSQEIFQMEKTTLETMKKDLYDFVDQIIQMEEKIRRKQQICKDKEAQIEGLVNAQNILKRSV